MKENQMSHSIEFYKECADYINNGHSLTETSDRDFIYQNDEIKLLRKYEKFKKIPC